MGAALRRRRRRLFPRHQPQQALAHAQHGGAGRPEDSRRTDREGRRADRQFPHRHAGKMGLHRSLVRAARAAAGALLDHRLRHQRTARRAARLRLHPAGRVRADEHLWRARRRADQVRRGDRRRLHRDAGIERHPGGDQRPPPHRQGPEGRAIALRNVARDADQRRAELSARRPRRRTLRQRSSQHRAVHHLPGRRRHDRDRHRQRTAVLALRRGARPSRMGDRTSATTATAPGSKIASTSTARSTRRSQPTPPTPGSPS